MVLREEILISKKGNSAIFEADVIEEKDSDINAFITIDFYTKIFYN